MSLDYLSPSVLSLLFQQCLNDQTLTIPQSFSHSPLNIKIRSCIQEKTHVVSFRDAFIWKNINIQVKYSNMITNILNEFTTPPFSANTVVTFVQDINICHSTNKKHKHIFTAAARAFCTLHRDQRLSRACIQTLLRLPPPIPL